MSVKHADIHQFHLSKTPTGNTQIILLEITFMRYFDVRATHQRGVLIKRTCLMRDNYLEINLIKSVYMTNMIIINTRIELKRVVTKRV